MTQLEAKFLELVKKAVADGGNSFNELMNQPPPQEWLKVHPMAKTKDEAGNTVPARYMPIERAMWIVRSVFPFYEVQVIETKQVLNSIVCVVKVTLQNPQKTGFFVQHGVGACAIQMDAGASATDLAKIKNAGVQMAAPAAKTYAIKDALQEHYRIFGTDVNHSQIDAVVANDDATTNTPIVVAPAATTMPTAAPPMPTTEQPTATTAQPTATTAQTTSIPSITGLFD